jgi:hypothetical protein
VHGVDEEVMKGRGGIEENVHQGWIISEEVENADENSFCIKGYSLPRNLRVC